MRKGQPVLDEFNQVWFVEEIQKVHYLFENYREVEIVLVCPEKITYLEVGSQDFSHFFTVVTSPKDLDFIQKLNHIYSLPAYKKNL